jgi:predicted AAA+ superfamily ATPase
VYQEIADQFDLQKALTIGTLPEVYLHDYGPQLLESYVDTYLREEVQAEALTKDLGAYARFLDMAASVSGQFLNYSKIASDTDIHKETIRRYFEILADTLLIERLPSYTDVPKERKARQKEKFIFFDLGVRNAILKRVGGGFSQEEMGQLFEQWIQLQCIYLNRCNRLQKKLSTFRDARGLEVDLIIESEQDLLLVEVKWSTKVKEKYFSNLHSLEKIISANNALTQNVKKIVVYRGEHKQKFSGDAFAVPYRNFLEEFTAKSGF